MIVEFKNKWNVVSLYDFVKQAGLENEFKELYKCDIYEEKPNFLSYRFIMNFLTDLGGDYIILNEEPDETNFIILQL